MSIDTGSSRYAQPTERPAVESTARLNRADAVDELTRLREVLSLWLKWNERYEKSIEEVAKQPAGQNVEDYLDQLDQLRFHAAAQSKELVE